MASVNLRVIQGADRGKTYTDLRLPITIGREEGNAVQLNDERISRYHIKILEDNQHIVLTDLDSTNGTRVNGQDTQLRILRFGDLISVGRSVLLYGTREEIAQRVQDGLTAVELNQDSPSVKAREGDFELEDAHLTMQKLASKESEPRVPERLTPSQSAQLSELLEHFHGLFGSVVEQAKIPEHTNTVKIDLATWQLILQMYSRTGELIRSIADPDL